MQENNQDIKLSDYFTSTQQLISEHKALEPVKFIYGPIKERSWGLFFGPPKSGKTIFCENLSFAFSNSSDSFLEIPIEIKGLKCFFISLEEDWRGRTERQMHQLEAIGEVSEDSHYSLKDGYLKHLNTDADWITLKDTIAECSADIVFIDSLTHMAPKGIHDSIYCQEITAKIDWLQEETGKTLIIIHHATKGTDRAMNIESMAGSRILSQEADFMIGISRNSLGIRYVKEVTSRYRPETIGCKTFEISESCTIVNWKDADETSILSQLDNRKNRTNRDHILEFFTTKQSLDKSEGIEGIVIVEWAKSNSIMGRSTVYTNLNKMVTEKELVLNSDGKYSLPEYGDENTKTTETEETNEPGEAESPANQVED